MTDTTADPPTTVAELERLAPGDYPARITHLKGSPRIDVEVTDSPTPMRTWDATDVVAQLRRFFDSLEAESEAYDADPVALTHAHARMDALLADVRYVRDSVARRLAERLNANRIRRLTVTGTATVEGTGSIDRSAWEHAPLLKALLRRTWPSGLVDRETGLLVGDGDMAGTLLTWMTPSWKLTGVKAAGLKPDDYCTVATDDDGKPQSTPSVRMVDNSIRRLRS